MSDPTNITPADIEAKFRDIQSSVGDVAQEGKQRALPAAVAGAVVLVVVVYLIGRRAGKRKSTVVQIRRL